jgi:hypothetical protein
MIVKGNHFIVQVLIPVQLDPGRNNWSAVRTVNAKDGSHDL